jgi:signal transduction histidine kinase
MSKGASHRVRNQIILAYVIALVIVAAFGVYVFSVSMHAQSLIDASAVNVGGLEDDITALTKAAFIFLSVGIVVFSGIMFSIIFSVTPALQRLTAGIRQIAAGNMDYRVKLPVHNEFGDIANFFNGAIDNVVKTQQSLEVALARSQELQDELAQEKAGVERQVAQRTHELRDEQARFLASIKSLPMGFMFVNDQGQINMINPVMQKLLAINPDDAAALEKALTAKDSLLMHLLEQTRGVKGSEPHTDLQELKYHGKVMRALLAPVQAESTPESMGVVVLLEDVTEAKIMERSKDEFFSIASHELRTPLTAIRGNTSMIKEYYGAKLPDQEVVSMVDDIHSSSVRLIEIVNDFLDASRLEQGKMEIKAVDMPLEPVLETVAYELSSLVSERGVYLKVDTKTLDALPLVHADPDRVKQIVYNLVGNALKFVERGGVTISTALEGRQVKIRVTDTGRGISPENQQLLFHKFQQASKSLLTRDTTRGTGLGLYISRLLCGLMGGQVELEHSEVGKGSTFSFTLPVARTASGRVHKPRTTHSA